MGYDIEGEGGRPFRANGFGWTYLLTLARDNGWEPMGTTMSGFDDSRPPSDWNGGYCSNDFQRVEEEDASNMANALEKALQACRQHCAGELYVVFGCGGDRDKGKRPLMAQAAEKYADYLVVTNDNPRSEDAQLIANDIVAGFTNPDAEQITII